MGKAGIRIAWPALLALLALVGGCEQGEPEAGAGAAAEGGAPSAVAQQAGDDGDKADFRDRLLELALDTASAMPNNPHIKPKSRAQEGLMAVCLELDRPDRALRCIKQIGNWRRGMGYADLAYYLAKRNENKNVPEYLDRAAEISRFARQAWRRDRIRVRMAQTYALLGEHEKAAELQGTVVESETGKTAGVGRSLESDEAFQDVVRSLDKMVESGNFDLINNALHAYARLYGRFYENAERRELLERKLRQAWEKMPPLVKIRVLRPLTEAAIEHGDSDKALELADETKALIDGARWPPRHHIPLLAEEAELRFRAGDEAEARANTAAARELFEAKLDEIQSFDRAESLRPVAVTYRVMGDTETALEVYRQVVEQGAVNPNAMQRAVDLSATLGSMALHGVEPDDKLWGRVREIRAGLGDPW